MMKFIQFSWLRTFSPLTQACKCTCLHARTHEQIYTCTLSLSTHTNVHTFLSHTHNPATYIQPLIHSFSSNITVINTNQLVMCNVYLSFEHKAYLDDQMDADINLIWKRHFEVTIKWPDDVMPSLWDHLVWEVIYPKQEELVSIIR